MTSETPDRTDIEVLKAVKMATKHSPYAGSFRTPEIGPRDIDIIDIVGREQEFGVYEANQSVLKLVKRGFLIRMPEGRSIISTKGSIALESYPQRQR